MSCKMFVLFADHNFQVRRFGYNDGFCYQILLQAEMPPIHVYLQVTLGEKLNGFAAKKLDIYSAMYSKW